VKATLPVTPTKIKLAAGNDTLTIQWSDGHLSAYPYRYLRDKCPCASRSGLEPRAPVPGSPFPIFGAKPLRPERAELVGRYAVQIYWTDSHSAGIYSFAFLREMCPCAECMAKGKDTSGA
jgi:DUF971 family protein